MSESTTESNKIKAIGKSIKKWDWNAIVKNAPVVSAIFFFLGYLYSILHRLSEHNFEYLKACTKEKEAKYIDLFIIEPCLCYDVACGFFFLFLLIDVGQKLIKRYKITNNQFVFLLVLELSYYVVRGQSWNDYTLTHFERWTSLYYADVIWLFGLYLIFFKSLMGKIQKRIKWTPVKITKEEKNEPNNIKGLLYDKKINEDNFQRKSFAEQLANRILATNNPEGSVAVAVTGEWASGKSTFLSYIKEYLEGKAIIIDMNPGATESKRLLVKDFFDTIAEELQSYDAAVSELVYDYVDSLLEVHENGIIKVLKKVFAFNKTNSAKERFKTLSECIKQLHQPLVIFIDDLDRLDKKETKEVLRLIRNTANFSRVIYIVAFDKDYVIAQIKTAHDETGKYLDKLFQLEVSLPFYESNKITDYLFKVLEERYPKKKDSIGVLKSQAFIGDFVKSYRDVHRLVNSFSVIYDCFINGDLSEQEVDFCDLFLLEIIRLTDFRLYNKLYTVGSVRGVNEYEAEFDLEIGDTKTPIVDKFSQIFQFWKRARVGQSEKAERIDNVTYFHLYFRFRYADGQLSARELLKVLYYEEVYEQVKPYSQEDKARFISLVLKLLRNEYDKNVTITIAEIEQILDVFLKLYKDNERQKQEYSIELEPDNRVIPLDLSIAHIDQAFYHLFSLELYQILFNNEDFKRLLNKYLIEWFEFEISLNRDGSPELVLRFIINLKRRGIEGEYRKVALEFIRHCRGYDLYETWKYIKDLIKYSTEVVNFTNELESYIFAQVKNMHFFIKQIYKSDEEIGVLTFKLQIEFINKVWGDEASFKQTIKDKEGNCTADIKPILQQLSSLLDEHRSITKVVLKEEQYQELRLLEK